MKISSRIDSNLQVPNKLHEAVSSPIPTAEKTPTPVPSPEESTPSPIIPTPTPSVKERGPLYGKIICVDAGHGLNPSTETEQIAPNVSKEKRAFVSGTSGKNQTEEQLTLKLAMLLRANLEKLGADVYMTRTESKTTLSNIGRAKLANDVNANLSVKIHADGGAPEAHGISMLVPANTYIQNDLVYNESKKAGNLILASVIQKTGAKNRGVVERSDLTGFNWSTVPVILIETGFMTNPEEDMLLETEEYRLKIADGITAGILNYFAE